ncbi:MAG: metalloregulator ArsR/SmtB family transcription factor [Acutalibacteraceae bacterium]|nr:winged helix-turn-helix transcriptional regulator [Clostridia bacterium]MEE3450891.1 metalloregulator ArsR/SmtB family transcription factor [Acutalibacteraceae bacterium]
MSRNTDINEPICSLEFIHNDTVESTKSKLLSMDKYIELAALFKLFGDPTRVRILHALEQNELCVCDIASLLGLTKSAVSHQLKDLKLADLVKFRKEGQTVFYSLADSHVKTIIDIGYEHITENLKEV